MKKLNKLFAILIAVLGVQTLSAQTDVTSTYLTNADFSSTTGWTAYVSNQYKDYGNGKIGGKLSNYAASTTDATHLNSEYFFGFQCRWSGNYASYNQETSELPAGVYTLSFDVENVNGSTSAVNYNNLFYVKVGDKTFTDTSVEWMKGKSSWTSHSITFVITEATKATISLGYGTGSNNLISGSTPVLYVSHLKLIHRNIDDISVENLADFTSYIVNNSFETGDMTGWSVPKNSSDTGVKPNSNNTYKTTGVDGNYLFNTWWQGVPLTQTIGNIPNGIYELKVLLASDQNAKLFLLANDEHSEVYTITTDNKTFHDVSYEFKVLNGQATIGVIGGNDAGEYVNGGHWWYKADNFRLIYKGADLSLLQEAFNANYTNLKNLSTDDVPTAFATQITSLKSTYTTPPLSKAELNTANGKMEAIIAAYPSIAASYALLNELITLCSTYVKESYSNVQDEAQRTTLTTATTTASTDGNNATTVAELTEVYNTLETARQIFVLAAYPTSGNSFDMTFKITNPSFETGDLTGWTILQPSDDTGVKPNSNATYATSGVDGNYLFNTYWQGVPIKQTLVDLPTGTYTLTVAVASDGGTVYLTADDEHSAGQPTSNKTVFLDTSIEFLCTDGETTIGVVGGDNEANNKQFTENGYWWYKADNFRLTRAFDASTLQSSLSALKATAANLLTKPMDPSKKSQLQTANNNADVASDNPFDLGTWAAALETAIAEAQSSVNDYSKIQEYINKTKVFVDASKVATYQTKHDNCQYTAADVETVRRELNVMRYEAASTVFSNPYEVTGWTGALKDGVRSDQHWSGETKSYFDANSWVSNFVGLKHTLSTTVTLPEGTYVLKAAGRSSADATLRLNIKNGETIIESVDYTGKGDTGYGIDTSGAANFSAEGTYANDNAGRGWEWEFAKFELGEETTVTLHVEVDYNNIQNRFGSFSDITLWMDDATYVTVYGKELDAPLAEAKTLVNTLPMGTDQNTALAKAIAVGEGELSGPAALNAAVDGLKTAVVNANTWRNTYYTEKDKLVAALERFEADYNDAQNGALGHLYMCKSLWSTAINMAQAAAVAKDVRNSYDGFETAAKNLNDALDAVTRSDGEYEALDAAIKAAKPLYEGNNFGNNAFQIPASAKESLNTTNAQDIYTAATADGEDVTSVTANLNNGINTTLNAPAEGQRFYIKVATEGHGKNGNAWLVTLGATGDNNPTGYGINANNAVKGHLNQAFIFTQVEGNLYNISIEREEGTVYLTYGALNGSAADWKNQQIQATTDAEKKGEFKIVPTGKNGILKIFNTIDNNYLDCQGGGAIYTDTGIENEEFAFELASENTVTLTLSKVGWATLILPFNAELPEGVKAYSCSEANKNAEKEEEQLTLEEATSLKANTPYLMNGQEGTHKFSGYGLADKDSYTDGLFIGTYVEYKTTANSNTYVLQNHDGEVAFYLVGSGENAQPTVGAYRCYMVYDGAAGAPKFSFGRGGETTSIDNSEFRIQNSEFIYDLMGRKVNTMEKGKMYIVNGKKVVIR